MNYHDNSNEDEEDDDCQTARFINIWPAHTDFSNGRGAYRCVQSMPQHFVMHTHT